MKIPILTLIPSAYKTSKVYSVLPVNGDGDFDFSRNSNGTRVQENGLIENKTNNVPRLDWLNSNCPSLLLEPQRTNLMASSGDFNYAGYDKTRCTVDSTNLISPDGTLNGNKIESTNTSVANIREFLSITAGSDFSMSFFVKKGTGTHISTAVFNSASSSYVRYFVDLETMEYDGSLSEIGTEISLISREIIDYGNGWHRIITNVSTNTTTGLNIYIYPQTNGTTFASTIGLYNYFWGWQTEVGNYVSSYIKTDGSTVTRLKDECINGGNSDLFDITEGTFFVDAYIPNNSITTIISLSNGSDSQKITLNFEPINSRVRTYSSGGVLYYDTLSYNQRNKILITFKLNEYKTYINGSLVSTDTSATVPTGMFKLNFSHNSGTILFFEGKVHDTRVYDRVLTEAEAIELTTL